MEYNIVGKAVRRSLNDDLKRHVDMLEKAIRNNRPKLGRQELAYHCKQISQVRKTDRPTTTSISDIIKVTASECQRIKLEINTSKIKRCQL